MRIATAVWRHVDKDITNMVLVSADITPGVKTVNNLLEAVIRAVTKWIKTTDEGRKAWVYSSADLNIGDLSSYVGDGENDDPELVRCLEDEGVKNFRIEDLDADTPWVYDTILADSSQLVEDEDDEDDEDEE